jgi:hypothetical protein
MLDIRRPSPRTRLRSRLCLVAGALACAAVPASAPGAGAKPLSPALVRYWTAVGSCETGAGGPPKWDWGSKRRPGEGSLYEGGLGISAAMWLQWATELGLAKRYPHGYVAPPLVQMQVAEYGVDAHGARWGCKP